MDTIGRRLKYLRERKEWSKTYVSKCLNLKNLSTYSNWEYDLNQPNLKMIVELAELYDVSTDYLLGKKEREDSIPGELLMAFSDLTKDELELLLDVWNVLKTRLNKN